MAFEPDLAHAQRPWSAGKVYKITRIPDIDRGGAGTDSVGERNQRQEEKLSRCKKSLFKESKWGVNPKSKSFYGETPSVTESTSSWKTQPSLLLATVMVMLSS